MSISLSFRISQKSKNYLLTQLEILCLFLYPLGFLRKLKLITSKKKKKTSNIGKYKPNENQSPNNDYRRLFLK